MTAVRVAAWGILLAPLVGLVAVSWSLFGWGAVLFIVVFTVGVVLVGLMMAWLFLAVWDAGREVYRWAWREVRG